MRIGEGSPVKCIAPWRALCVKADGKVVPDIQFRQVLGNLNQQTLEEILSQSVLKDLKKDMMGHRFHEGCRNCKMKEDSGGRSRRTFFYDVLYEKIESQNYPLNEEPDFYFLEINTSNKCNLKCRMCGGAISSAWMSDEKALAEMDIDLQRPQPGYRFNSSDTIDNLFSNPNFFRNLSHLALRGGEPLYEKANLHLFDKIDELGLTKQIHLDISTNGTVLSEKVLEALSRFESVEIYLSIEGVGPAYQYIRAGENFSISDLEKNIEKLGQLPNVTIVYTFLSMVYNLGEINSFWSWYESVRKPGDEVSLSNMVVNPEYLNFQILPDEIKQQYFCEINEGPVPKGEYDTGKRVIRDVGIESILSGLEKRDYYDNDKLQVLRKQFRLFNDKLDQIRNTSLHQALPRLSEWYSTL